MEYHSKLLPWLLWSVLGRVFFLQCPFYLYKLKFPYYMAKGKKMFLQGEATQETGRTGIKHFA